MQRSRRALLQRRDLEKSIDKSYLYKFSISFTILLWGLIFLLNSWISHGNGYRDESEAEGLRNVHRLDESKLARGSDASLANNHLTKVSDDYPETSSIDVTNVEEVSGEVESSKHTDNGLLGSKEHIDTGTAATAVKNRQINRKTARLTRTMPFGLDEYKNKALNARNTYVPGSKGNLLHRVEPGGAEYNYASSAKGAKVLDSNKEGKGVSNILSKDKDKYLRNPCSAQDKFVVIELSEETLVDTIEIANFEHYASRLKDFELLGSVVYPTDSWVKLGNFSAENVKQAQTFSLLEPRWVRYVKLNMLSHYGSEFYCTLSSIEVYGVDALELMLEDLIVSDKNSASDAKGEQESLSPHVLEIIDHVVPDQNPLVETDRVEGSNFKHESVIHKISEPLEEVRHQQVSRMPGDTVLKILMEKVRALDLNLSVLERYLEEISSRYGSNFEEFDKEMDEKALLLEKIRSDIKYVHDSKDAIAKDVDELMAWRSKVSIQLDHVMRDNVVLRSDVKKVLENQVYMESKGIVVFLTSVIFGFVAIVILFTNMVHAVHRSEKFSRFCWTKSCWFILFLSCSTTIVILSV